jgi:hypothetical protein
VFPSEHSHEMAEEDQERVAGGLGNPDVPTGNVSANKPRSDVSGHQGSSTSMPSARPHRRSSSANAKRLKIPPV